VIFFKNNTVHHNMGVTLQRQPTEVFCKLSVLQQSGSSNWRWCQEAELFCRTNKILLGSLEKKKRGQKF